MFSLPRTVVTYLWEISASLKAHLRITLDYPAVLDTIQVLELSQELLC
jgi:hypothetical protein